MTSMKPEITTYLNIAILFICSALFTSCEKAPANGKVDGHWQLMSFETTDGTVHPCERIYYSIQLQLVEISEKRETEAPGYGSFIGRFEYNPDTRKITVSDFRKRWEEDTPATKEQLMPFGMNRTETVFDVIEADGKTLVLRSDYATLTFRIF